MEVTSYSQQHLLERDGLNPLHGVDVEDIDGVLTVHRQVGGVVAWTKGEVIVFSPRPPRVLCMSLKRISLTGRVGERRPHQLLLPGAAALGVHVHADGVEAQQQLLAGDLHGAQGVQALLGNEGQGVVLVVEQVDGGHVTVDTVEVITGINTHRTWIT